MGRRHAITVPVIPPTPTRVEIITGGHQVIIECGEPMEVVVRTALGLWRDTKNDTDHGQLGFSMQSSAGEPVISPMMGPEFVLPHRMQPGPVTDDQH